VTYQTSQPLDELRLSMTNRSAREIARMASEWGWMTLDAPYQRGHVWTVDQRMALVRSWVQRIPIPAIIVNLRHSRQWTDNDDQWDYAVIDGKQRVQTAIEWFNGDLAVPASWFDPEDIATTEDTGDGPYVRFTGLTKSRRTSEELGGFQLGMCEAQLPSVAAESAVYVLVNGGGTPQTDADMARAADIAREG
jgi:hypothetical protein